MISQHILLQAGTDINRIKHLLGHTNIQSTTFYLHLLDFEVELISPLDMMDEKLGTSRKVHYFWKELIKMFAVNGQTFEIHCWNQETVEIALALQLGKQKLVDWECGVIIEGVIDDNFIDMLCNIEKPLNTDLDNKMTPIFSIFFNNGFSSEHYGTEIHICSEPTDKSKLHKLLDQIQDYAEIDEYSL